MFVSDITSGTLSIFNSDTDGQHYNSATNVSMGVFGLATSGGKVFAAMPSGGGYRVAQLNSSGAVTNSYSNGALWYALAISNAPGNSLLVASGANIYSIANDLTDASFHQVLDLSGHSVDGLTTAGNVVYVAVDGNRIEGFNISNGYSKVFDSGLMDDGPDGATAGFGSLAGKLFVNTNGGNVWEIDTSTQARTLIASGGSRGDLIGVDYNDGSLLLTQSDSVLRLSPFSGTFADPQSETPEPGATATLAGFAIIGLLAYRRRRTLNP